MTIYPSPIPSVPLPHSSVYDQIFESFTSFSGDSVALIDAQNGRVMTRGEVRTGAIEFCAKIRNVSQAGALEIPVGSTVTVFSPNTVLYLVIVLGLTAAGVRVAFANTGYKPAELAHVIKDSSSSHVFAHPDVLQVVIEAFALLGRSKDEVAQRVILIAPNESIPAEMKGAWIAVDDLVPRDLETSTVPVHHPEPEETAFIYYSSGTTGFNKGVELSHWNITSVLAQSAAAWSYYSASPELDKILGVVPFYHVFGGIILLLHGYKSGIPIVVMSKFDPKKFLSSIEEHKVTFPFLVPPLLNFLAKHPLVKQYDLTSMRVIIVGGAPLSIDLIKESKKQLSARGVKVAISQALGLTETSGCVSFSPLEHWEDKIGSVGVLLPNMECRLVGEDGEDVSMGEPGELWLRGPNIMKGYLNNPEANLDTITTDGWLKTGDIVKIDSDRFLTVVDRRKELIKYKGFQVPPAELEALLCTHPLVADACVIGTYSEEQATEIPRGYVVPKDSSVLAQSNGICEEIEAWIKERVAKFKQLRGGVVLVKAIPRSTSGKILRREMRKFAGDGA